MFHIEHCLEDARQRQASLRPASPHRHARRRPGAARLRLGAWIIRLGRAVAGRAATTPAWQR